LSSRKEKLERKSGGHQNREESVWFKQSTTKDISSKTDLGFGFTFRHQVENLKPIQGPFFSSIYNGLLF